ncbi:hypothetical protein BDD12DRAFT_899234 [Trichophaea hybrida]|nr:hypothetical protein BDD12DRAFT_899234 [Trichophaea hybrida]
MSFFYRLTLAFSVVSLAVSQISDSTFSKLPNALTIPSKFDPIIPAYWTGLPHHRRTPFAISPDGTTAYLAYLTTSYASVVVQPVDPTTFTAKGSSVEIQRAREVSGLVAQNDGFAVLVKVDTDAPGVPFPIATIMRYKGTTKAWERAVNGPSVNAQSGHSSSPDMNGDLVYSDKAGLYAAYFVVAAYSGAANGHYGDSIQYVDDTGALKTMSGASSTFGCSHNTGIAFEAADAAPFASVCAEDHGSIWLNTNTQYMGGVKIANENTTNGVSGEPMGGMGGSYSALSRFIGSDQYIFAWASRGAVNLTPDTWMGDGYVQSSPRWLNHNAAISIMATKSTLAGAQAISQVGASSGDSQVIWVTKSDSVDHQNIHVAAFNDNYALVTYEILDSPDCQPVPLSCTGTFSGTGMQLVDKTGKLIGSPVVAADAYVAGDMVNVGDKLCWPYVQMTWDLSQPKSNGTYTNKISFACMGLQGGSTTPTSNTGSNPNSNSNSNPTTPKPTPSPMPRSNTPAPSVQDTTPKDVDSTQQPAKNTTQHQNDTTKPKDTTPVNSSSNPKSNSQNCEGFKKCTSQTDCGSGYKCLKVRAGRSVCVPAS